MAIFHCTIGEWLTTIALLVLPHITLAQNANFVKTETMLDDSQYNKITSYQFYDGLGRSVQTATNGIAPNGSYIYSHQEYADYDQIVKKWLPVCGTQTLEIMTSNDMASISNRQYGTAFSYTEDRFDALSRKILQAKAGQDWVGAGKVTAIEYLTNSSDVHRYTAPLEANSLQNEGFYEPGTLRGVKTTDEDGSCITEYVDIMGHTVLERRSSDAGNNDTYYVYNDLGQLRFVLSPRYQDAGYKALYAYEYRYDDRGNILKKILPGCEYIQYWYDKADRVTFMQDARLRKRGKYRFTLYDRLGRLAVQGLCSGCNRGTGLLPVVTYVKSCGGLMGTDYHLDKIGLLQNPELEAVYYYDGYEFLQGSLSSLFSALTVNTAVCTKGLETGCIIKSSNNEYVCMVKAYDINGNVTETASHGLGAFVGHVSNSHTFTDNLRESAFTMDFGCNDLFRARQSNTYNRYNDKLESCSITVSRGGVQASAVLGYAYDDLGRLASVTRPFGSSDAGKVKYTYDLHGWPTSITTNSFAERLWYADGLGTPCYNGNVSSMKWQNSNYSQVRGYKFSYDGLNRLTEAVYGERESMDNLPNRYNEKVEYDSNGNITHLQRRGLKQDGYYGKIDNLTLEHNGNQLTYVEDDALNVLYNGAFDFRGDGSRKASRRFDGTGSLVSDTGRGIALIEYDDAGWPRRIQFMDGNVTEYVYTVTGEKLRTTHYTAVPNITVAVGNRRELGRDEILFKDSTDYLLGGSLILRNGKVDKYLFAGGYCQVFPASASADSFRFFYYNTDHLGNIREVVDDVGRVVQVTNYYAFGAPFCDGISTVGRNVQPYKYNGKELDLMHGLNTYDYGARQYDPILGSWDRMDPLCEKYYSVSPYAYCHNNPVMLVDPDGREVRIENQQAYMALLNTISQDDRQYVILNENGSIDYERMRLHQTESENYNALLNMASSEMIITLNVSEGFQYTDNDGVVHSDKLTYCEPDPYFADKSITYTSGLTTGETGKFGITLLPGEGTSGINSVDRQVHVFVHPSLSEIGMAEAISHEFFGHGYMFFLTKDRNKSAHDTRGTSVEFNTELKNMILRSRRETINYFRR